MPPEGGCVAAQFLALAEKQQATLSVARPKRFEPQIRSLMVESTYARLRVSAGSAQSKFQHFRYPERDG
jgi:hypothetical protein